MRGLSGRLSSQAEEDSDFERRQHRKRRRRRDRHRRHRAERSDSVDKSDSSLEKAVHAYRKKLRQRKKDGRRMSDGLPLSSTDDEAEGWADWRRRMKKLYRFCKTEVEESEESDGGDRGGVKSPGIVGERGFVEGQKRGEESGSGRGERGGAEREGWERREQETGARRGEHGSRSVDKEWFGEMRREGRRGKRTERTLDEMYEARGEQMGVPNDRRRWSDDDGRRRVDDVAAAEGPTRGTSLSELPGTRKDHHWRGRFGDVSGRDDDVSRTGPSRAATASGLPRRGGLKRSWGEQDEGREGAQDGFNKKQARVRWEDEESPEGARTEDVSKKVSSGDAAAQGLGVQESERWNGGEENGGYRERFEEGEEERGAERSSVEQRGSVGVAGVRRVVQSLSDLTRRRKGGAQAGEEGSRHEGLAGQVG